MPSPSFATPPLTAAAQQDPGWWERNWKWAVPSGCLSLILVVGGFAALIVTFVFGMMKSTDAYKDAMAKAAADSRVIAALGSPIKADFLVTGNVEINGSSGRASLAIPLSGPRGAATLFVEAQKSAGAWTFLQLVLQPKNSKQRIDLLTPVGSESPPAPGIVTAPALEK